MDKILISGCLYGLPVRYDGKDNLLTDSLLQQWQQQDRLIVLCPEVSGGLPTPRPPAEIQADGIIRTKNNIDVTDAFMQGAHQAVMLCQQHNIKFAILKENSPSCGSHFIYDGQFNGTKVTGQGLTAAALTKMGVQVFSENQLNAVAAALNS